MGNEVDNDPLGRPYRIIMARAENPAVTHSSCPILLGRILVSLFPRQKGNANAVELPVDAGTYYQSW